MSTKQIKKNTSNRKKAPDTITKKSVFVGLSGGVDSSVTAALLKKAGYEVTGVFMKVWEPDFLPCTWREERLDAMRVASQLGISFLTWDFEEEYKKGVADYMIQEYKAGRTPNPDVMCNKEVKFGGFLKRALEMGADFVATGHYAQVVYDKKTQRYTMLAGVDKGKDQSYFLWMLGQNELSKTLFPIGRFKKLEVRVLAKKFGLPTATKKDSQGLCFVGKLDMKDFLAHFLREEEGSVLDVNGREIGTHRGAYFFTLGERHGFTVTKKSTNDMAYYVTAKDIVKNTITVSHEDKAQQFPCSRKHVVLEQANFCRGVLPDISKECTAQVRYHGEFYKCSISSLHEGGFSLEFVKPVLVASGQSIVLYNDGECLGGAVVAI